MPDIPFILPFVNLSLVAGVIIFVLRVVVKGTWMHKDVHDEIVADWREKYQELKADRDWWRQSTMNATGMADRILTTTEQVVKATNGNGGKHATP